MQGGRWEAESWNQRSPGTTSSISYTRELKVRPAKGAAQGDSTCGERTRTRIQLSQTPVQDLPQSPTKRPFEHQGPRGRPHVQPQELPTVLLSSKPKSRLPTLFMNYVRRPHGHRASSPGKALTAHFCCEAGKATWMIFSLIFPQLSSSLTRGLKQAAFKKVSRII